MQLGRFKVEQLNEGQFELFGDGKINRTPVGETDEHASITAKNRSLMGINPLYVTDGTRHILLDAGLGWGLDVGSLNTDVSNIRTNLGIFGTKPADITHIILTHLHYDHAAGLSWTDEKSQTCPTFPYAACFLHQTEWEFAVRQVSGIHSTFYQLDDLYRLYADDCFEFVEKNETEILPGITLIKTGGHTPGHQVVKLSDKGKTAYFWGDLVPTPDDLNYFNVTNPHINRIQVKKMKIKLLRKACREKAFLFFYHSVYSRTGQLEVDKNKKYVLREL